MTAQPHEHAPAPWHDGRADKSLAAVRGALLPEDLPDFEAEYEAARQRGPKAARECLERWWGPAMSAWHDPEAHRQAMEDARRLLAGEYVETIPWEETAARLGLPSAL